MLDRSGLATMRPQNEGVETPFCPKMVQNSHVGIHVVNVVCVGRVLIFPPFLGCRNISIEKWIFRFAFIIHRIESNNVPLRISVFFKLESLQGTKKFLLAQCRNFDYLNSTWRTKMRCSFFFSFAFSTFFASSQFYTRIIFLASSSSRTFFSDLTYFVFQTAFLA